MLKPGDLTIVNPDKGKFNERGGVHAAESQLSSNGIWLSVPFIVLAVFKQDSYYDHNLVLLGANGVIGWIPEDWVKKC